MFTRELVDVTIIGAGVVGASIARELSKYELRVLLIDKNSEVGFGISKSSTANIIEKGGQIGALREGLIVSGNKMFDKLTKDLDVPLKWIGLLYLARNESEVKSLKEHKSNEKKYGFVEMIGRRELRKKEPNIAKDFIAALYNPRFGVVPSYELVPGLVENAQKNGVELLLDTEAKKIYQKDKRIIIESNEDSINSRFVINAAGLGAVKIARMVDKNISDALPQKEVILVLEKRTEGMVNHGIIDVRSGGAYINPRCAGTITLGMRGVTVDRDDDRNVPGERIQKIVQAAKRVIPAFSPRDIIKSFAGVCTQQPTRDKDYLIGPSKTVSSLINVRVGWGGLTSSPAIAKLVVKILIKQGLDLIKNPNFDPCRQGIPKIEELTDEKKKQLIKKDKRYGHIVCRCEHISEGEIVEAIKRGARTLDGVKGRTRAGMGRCQGGFCGPRVLQILSRELNLPVTKINKKGRGSELVRFKTKELLEEGESQ